jgi:PadR family transcriptional regulator PadR
MEVTMSGVQAKKKKRAADESAAMDHDKFVREGPQKRYQLTEDIGNLPFPGPIPDSAAVYRMLRDLEKTGLVRSEWEHGEVGPSKRVYSITHQGEERLDVWVKALGERVKMLNSFISLCKKVG